MFPKMKFAALSAFVLLLAACSSGNAEQDEPIPPSDDRSRETTRLEAGGERDLPVQMQLILGTLQLEGTDLAVNSDQAAELIPLWKAMRSLSSSDTAAEAEIEAVINQIQDAMTPEQIEAIAAQELSPEDIQTIVQELGIAFGPPAGFEGLEGGDFPFPPGGPGGGGPFGEGGPPGGFPDDFDFDSEAAATLRAEASFSGFSRLAGNFLMEPLIEMLEQRAGLVGT